MLRQSKSIPWILWFAKLISIILLGVTLNHGFSFSEEIRYHSGGRRDPFVPVTHNAVPVAAVKGIAVEGIIYDKSGKSLVVIHGEMYRVGDTVDEQKIIAIHTNKIVVSAKGVESEYWISGAEEQLAQKANQ